MVKFSDWITGKFVEWRGQRVGNSASVKEFARQFGVSQQVMSNWMNGALPTQKKYINALLAAYPDDPDIYAALGLLRPGEEVISLDQLAPADREALLSAFEDAGFPVNSDDDLRRMIKALEANGIKVTRKR